MTTKTKLLNIAKLHKGFMNLWGGFLIIILAITFSSCRKDNTTAQISGRWKGTMSIWKRTTYINGSISSENSDTTDWTKPGYTTSLEFSGDTVNFYYAKPSYIMDYHGLKYILNTDKLQFYNNPFSYRSSDTHFGLYPTLPVDQRDICSVAELTSSKLVLYDKDTINRNPTIVWQQWNTFTK